MGRPLRVALVSYRSKPHCGGQGIYLRHLSRELAALGHQVEVFSGQPYPELEPGPVLRLEEADAVEGEPGERPELPSILKRARPEQFRTKERRLDSATLRTVHRVRATGATRSRPSRIHTAGSARSVARRASIASSCVHSRRRRA